MNVLNARVALRERSLLDILDLSLRFVVSHLGDYARVAGVVLVPSFLVTWAIGEKLGWVWAWCAAVILSMIAGTPFTALASRLVFEPKVSTGEALRAALRSLGRMIPCRIVQVLGFSMGFLFFMIPGVWVALLFFLVSEVVVLEHAGMGTALTRLQRLMTGHSGDILMAMLMVTALQIAAVFLGDVVGRGILEELLQINPPEPISQTGGSALGLLGFWLALPFLTTTRLFVYLNLRTRREGWDIQTRFAAIDARAQGALAAGDHA